MDLVWLNLGLQSTKTWGGEEGQTCRKALTGGGPDLRYAGVGWLCLQSGLQSAYFSLLQIDYRIIKDDLSFVGWKLDKISL